MECTWDTAILQRLHELPDELIEAIRLESSNEDYLSIFTRASIDPRYTYTLYAHAPDLFAHICADIRRHTSLSNSIATLGRVVPFAPYLTPFAQELLSSEQHDFGSDCDVSEHVSYLLGVLRLLNHEHRAFSYLIDPSIISSLLHRKERPIVYLAIRVLQIVLNGADHWFEEMVSRYLGDDTPDNAIDGLWDGKSIDYRFFGRKNDTREFSSLSERFKMLANRTVHRRASFQRHVSIRLAHLLAVLYSLISADLHTMNVGANWSTRLQLQATCATPRMPSNHHSLYS
jgi:midasin